MSKAKEEINVEGEAVKPIIDIKIPEKYNFDDYKNDKLVRPRDIAWSNWAKFANVGDKVQGYIRDVFYRKAEGQFEEQRGLTIEQKDGSLINVAIKRLPFILPATDNLRIGDPITIELAELKKSDTKGFSPTKIYAYYGKNVATEGLTVQELEQGDKIAGGTVAPVEEAKEDIMPEVKTEDIPFP